MANKGGVDRVCCEYEEVKVPKRGKVQDLRVPQLKGHSYKEKVVRESGPEISRDLSVS